VTLCVACTVHIEMRSMNFLVEPQNQGQRFDLKTTRTVCQWFDLKINRTVYQKFNLKITGTVSLGLFLKPVARIFWFGPQNQ
jgi:hypothetical protein